MEDRRYDDTVENPKTEAVFCGAFWDAAFRW